MKKEKIYNLLLFILLFMAIISIILISPLNNLDELWNYNFARNVSNGLVPYKDFNMLQMPLLPLICGFILKIITNELIVMRVLAAILCSLIIYSTYKLFSILNIRKEINIFFITLIFFLFYNIFCIDYNYATLLLVLFIIYKEIKMYKEDNIFIKNDYKIDFILGILAGLTVTLKQTTGLFICIALLGNKLLFVREKNEFKIYIKCFIFRVLGILIPVISMLMYLICNNAFEDFISYTIKGVSGFSNYISYTNLIQFNVVGVLSLLVPITFVCAWIKTICLEKEKISYIFLVYGLAMFVVCFPISDKIHFLIGALPTIILILSELYVLLKKVCKKYLNKNIIDYIISVCISIIDITIITVIATSFINLISLIKVNYSTMNSYKFIPISEKLEEEINSVNNYITSSSKEIKILDATAAIYMIPVKRYNKDYDMLLKGNLGYNGESKIIEEIKTSTNTQYLILKDKYGKNWQTPFDIINYVKENKTKVGEIEIFDIYE